MDPKLKEVAKAKQEEGKVKQTDALIKSIVALNKNFVKSNKTEDDKKKSTLGDKFTVKSLVDAFKQKGTGKLKSVKDMFSIQNVLGALGQGKGTVLGEIAENRANTAKAKIEAEAKKTKSAEVYATESEEGIAWKKKYEEAMDKGDALSEDERVALTEEYNKLLEKGNDLYEKRLVMEKRIAELEKSEQDAESVGIVVSEEKRTELRKLKDEYNPHESVKKEEKKQKKGRGSQFLKGTATVSAPDASKKISLPPREGAPTEDMMSVLERKMREADMKQHPELYPELAETKTSPVEPVNKKPVVSQMTTHDVFSPEEAKELTTKDMEDLVTMVLKREGQADTHKLVHKDVASDWEQQKWEQMPMVGTSFQPLKEAPLIPAGPKAVLSEKDRADMARADDFLKNDPVGQTLAAKKESEKQSKLAEEQLSALNKLIALSAVSEEDRLEAKKPESTVEKIKKETPADPVQKKSILDRAKDLAESVRQRGKDLLNKLKGSPGESFVQRAKNGAGSILKSGSTIAGSAASAGGGILSSAGSLVSKVALPALAVAGAGAAGYAAGQWLNENTDIQKNIAGGVDTVKGWFGNSDEDKQKEAEKKATQDLYDKRVQEGKLTPKAAEYFEKQGIKVDKTKINTVANLEKPATTSREVQTANLEQSTAEAATIAAKETAGTNKGPAVVDASVKSITNNNTVQTKPSPPVRNFEPSFNTRLRSQFA